jgi:hypothetical protein
MRPFIGLKDLSTSVLSLSGFHLFPFFMATEQEQTIKLICFIEADDNPFLIILPVSATVDQLRRTVHQFGLEQRGESFPDVRFQAVTLRKVCPEFHIIVDLVNCLVWLMHLPHRSI